MQVRSRLLLPVALTLLSCSVFSEITGAMPIAWKWQQPTAAVPGQIDAADGAIYAAIGNRIYAMAADSGNQLWRFPVADPLPSNFRSGCRVIGDKVVAGTDDNFIYALNRKTGQKAWEYKAEAPVIGAPWASGSLVICQISNSSIVALDAETGAPSWVEPLKIQDGISGSIVATDRTLIIPTDDRTLLFIDVLSKRLIANPRLADMGGAVEPVLKGDTVYVVSGDFVVGFDVNSGRTRATVNAREPITHSPAIGDRTVTVVTESGRVRTLNMQGKDTHKPIDLQTVAVNRPVYVGNRIVVNGANGSMSMLDPVTGDFLWNYIQRPLVKPRPEGTTIPPNFMSAAAPCLASGDTLFLLSRDGGLSAFDASNGVDLTPPSIKMIWPTPGAELNTTTDQGGQVSLFWELDDPSSGINMEKVKVMIDGREAEHTLTRDGLLYVDLGKPKNRAGDGRHQFQITATDWLGNSSKIDFVLTFDRTLPVTRTSAEGAGGGSGRGGGGGGGQRPD